MGCASSCVPAHGATFYLFSSQLIPFIGGSAHRLTSEAPRRERAQQCFLGCQPAQPVQSGGAWNYGHLAVADGSDV